MSDGMGPYDALPERFWICPTCRTWSGKAGHIDCTGPDGEPQPTPVECVPAEQIRGAVEALRVVMDRLGGERVDQDDVFAAHDAAAEALGLDPYATRGR